MVSSSLSCAGWISHETEEVNVFTTRNFRSDTESHGCLSSTSDPGCFAISPLDSCGAATIFCWPTVLGRAIRYSIYSRWFELRQKSNLIRLPRFSFAQSSPYPLMFLAPFNPLTSWSLFLYLFEENYFARANISIPISSASPLFRPSLLIQNAK